MSVSVLVCVRVMGSTGVCTCKNIIFTNLHLWIQAT